MKSIITLSVVLFTLNSWAQDMIIKNDKTELKTKVLEITETSIKYKQFDLLDGPTYNINKNEVFMIIYKGGRKEYIENAAPVRQTVIRNIAAPAQVNTQSRAVNTAANSATDGLAFGTGHKSLHFGLGFGSGGFAAAGGTVTLPPVQLRYEFAVTPKISVAAIVAAASVEFSMPSYGSGGYGTDVWEYNYLMFGGRGNYHFATSEKFDPYVGATLVYNSVSVSDESSTVTDVSAGGILAGAQIGANYYFSPKFGAWAEVGYGIGLFNVGITLKLNKN